MISRTSPESRKVPLRAPGGLAVAVSLLVSLGAPAQAGPFDSFSIQEINKYLVIATGEGTSGDHFESFNVQNVEIGADQELVSTSNNGSPSQVTGSFQTGSSPNLESIFIPTPGQPAGVGGNRWNDIDPAHGDDTVGIPDTLPGARPLFEGRDFSGNVALTGEFAEFGASSSDVHADIGIDCNRLAAVECLNPSSSNSYFDALDPNNEQDLNALAGINPNFDPTALTNELELARDEIVGLGTEFTIDQTFAINNLVNNNIKDSGSPFTLDLDAIDANNDGIAVIDIDVDNNSFNVNNTDWILQSTNDVFAIVRMRDGTGFDFSNSSIMLGDGNTDSTNVIDGLGALFFMDAYQGTNTLFELNNVILGGIALWDLTDFNPNRNTLLSMSPSAFDPAFNDNQFTRTVVNPGQNAQGCSQFISNQVLMSNARWNRCDFGESTVPVPSTLWCLGLGLLIFKAGITNRKPRRRRF